MPEISIVEAKEIIRAVKNKYNYDFSVFSLTSFRFKLDKIISRRSLRYPDILISRLLEDKDFFDDFLYDISIPSTEMFRDTKMWKSMIDKVLPETDRIFQPHVWFPDSVDGNDLFSMLVILNDLNRIKHFSFSASSISEKSLKNLSSGIFDNNNLTQSRENYRMIFPDYDLNKYLALKEGRYSRDMSLMKKVALFNHDLHFQPIPKKVNIIFFRNKLIKYNKEFQNHLLNLFVETLEPDGFLFTGYQEDVEIFLAGTKKMIVFNNTERIYRKNIK